jgi:hypothetical protein
MAYEFPTAAGVLRLHRDRRAWFVEFRGARHGPWPSADAAARAVARNPSGVLAEDRARPDVSEDLLDWRPLGESL